jgi:hypothetical protein
MFSKAKENFDKSLVEAMTYSINGSRVQILLDFKLGKKILFWACSNKLNPPAHTKTPMARFYH